MLAVQLYTNVCHTVNEKKKRTVTRDQGGAVPWKFVCPGLILVIIHLDGIEARL